MSEREYTLSVSELGAGYTMVEATGGYDYETTPYVCDPGVKIQIIDGEPHDAETGECLSGGCEQVYCTPEPEDAGWVRAGHRAWYSGFNLGMKIGQLQGRVLGGVEGYTLATTENKIPSEHLKRGSVVVWADNTAFPAVAKDGETFADVVKAMHEIFVKRSRQWPEAWGEDPREDGDVLNAQPVETPPGYSLVETSKLSSLLEDESWREAMECAGVDNWPGCEHVQQDEETGLWEAEF